MKYNPHKQTGKQFLGEYTRDEYVLRTQTHLFHSKYKKIKKSESMNINY